MENRIIVLDTETTGLDPRNGHRIIEIGCVEIANRRVTKNHYHQYIQPDRESDERALEIHGITTKYLSDKPRFAGVVKDFLEFVSGAELIIHNAPFDVGFLNHELKLLGGDFAMIDATCAITDTLVMAKDKFPGQRNSLDALCKRYGIENSHRQLHGALLDSEILADVYLAMTGGQTAFSFADDDSRADKKIDKSIQRLSSDRLKLNVVTASSVELEAHETNLDLLDKACGGASLWRQV